MNEVNTILRAKQFTSDFKFIDKTLLDDFYQVREEIKGYKHPTARLVGNEIVIDHAAQSLSEYWNNNFKDKKTLIQLDSLKNFGKYLQSSCSTGGTFKQNEISLQGDFREKVKNLLMKKGHKSKFRWG